MFCLTARDHAVLLLDGMDLEAQLLAVRNLLHRHREEDERLAGEIEALAERAGKASGEYGMLLENDWVDHLHGSVFQDAAHSMAAIGMIAPIVESLFVSTFRGIGALAPPAEPVIPVGARAAHAAEPEFWDPHFAWGRSGRKEDLVRGILQLADSSGLSRHLPPDLTPTLSALFRYRNRMFHNGFEWPKEQRTSFESLAITEGWPAGWFQRATSAGETWIIYMSDALISHSLDTIDRSLEGIGTFLVSRYTEPASRG